MLAASILCLALQSISAIPPIERPTGELRVFVEDETGTLLIDGWSIRRGRRSGTWVETKGVDPTTGVVSFAAVAEPTCFLQALHDTGEQSEPVEVAVEPWREGAVPSEHRLVFAGPTPERSLFVQLQGQYGMESVESLELVAIDRAGNEVALVRELDARRRYVARGVEPGGYRIELRDPRYLPLLVERHLTGTIATLQAIGSAGIEVEFVDALDGRALTPLDLCCMVSVAPDVQALIQNPGPAAGAAPKGTTAIDGLVPGAPSMLHASFARHLPATLELSDLLPGETRRITCRVERARAVSGTIRDPTGAPVEGVTVTVAGEASDDSSSSGANRVIFTGRVTVYPRQGGMMVVHGAPQATSSTLTTLVPSRAPAAICTSDAEGRFDLYGLAPGATQLHMSFTPWHRESIPLPSLSPLPLLDTAEAIASEGETEASDVPSFPLRAPGMCGADVEFVMPRGMNQAQFLAWFELDLQIGDGPWLRESQAIAPLVDARQTMRLRRMPDLPCRLVVSMRGRKTVAPLAPLQGSTSETFDFVPRAGTPTAVRVDLGPLSRNN